MTPGQDLAQRFLFESLDIQGTFVRLEAVWQQLQRDRHYPKPVVALLGELCAVTTLMAANLKHPEARLTLQVQGSGTVPLLVVDCMPPLNLRGFAKPADGVSLHHDQDMRALIGDGMLQLTLDEPGIREPYRSMVPLEGASVGEVFGHYLARSEQRAATFQVAANHQTASALFLQKLPEADQRDPDGWNRITRLAATVRDDELSTLPLASLLTRLFSEETIRLFDVQTPRHDFPRDPARIQAMLRGLGEGQLRDILAEQGVIEIHDDLSNHVYRFGPEDLDDVLHPGDLH